jgi:hypothetical protein
VAPNTIGDRRGRGLGGERGSPASGRNDHVDPAAHEIGREFRDPAVLAFRPAEFQRDVLPFLIATLGEALANYGDLLHPLGSRACVEETDHRHRALLLRAGRQRPRGSRAAERG